MKKMLSILLALLMILFLGSFAGVVIELLWCLIRNGYWESRSGLVWGPFNLLYGVGAVALTAALYPFRNNSGTVSFAGGLIVGRGVEYLCSLVQELCFGSRSWDYSGMPFNLNGRICLMYLSVRQTVSGELRKKEEILSAEPMKMRWQQVIKMCISWMAASFMRKSALICVP